MSDPVVSPVVYPKEDRPIRYLAWLLRNEMWRYIAESAMLRDLMADRESETACFDHYLYDIITGRRFMRDAT